MPLDLTEISTEELLKELSHRLECTKKPEKRLVLIGEWFCTVLCRTRHVTGAVERGIV